MKTSIDSSKKSLPKFPPFDLARLMETIFEPQLGEKLCILIDLDNPNDVKNFNFLKDSKNAVQKRAHDVFYQGLRNGLMQKYNLKFCDFFAYKKTGGSNLELPKTAVSSDGKVVDFSKDIYPIYDLILCITNFSATAPLTAAAKEFGFRGATMHGVNEVILNSGLAVDYNEVSREAELLRKGLTKADYVDIDFELEHKKYHLHIDLGKQEAQKSHGLCRVGPDIANLPAGEVYFVPKDAKGSFPIKFDDGTLGIMQVDKCRAYKVTIVSGNQQTIDELQHKFDNDPATGFLGELGFGTQVLPYAESDIQDEKIFGTFHIAIGRNDHLTGNVTLDKFKNQLNATHEDILFSSTKTPEIHVEQVRMTKDGKTEVLIENYEPAQFLWNLRKSSNV
jgi:aminopeptidase